MNLTVAWLAQAKDRTLVVLANHNGLVADDGYKEEALDKLGNHNPASLWLVQQPDKIREHQA